MKALAQVILCHNLLCCLLNGYPAQIQASYKSCDIRQVEVLPTTGVDCVVQLRLHILVLGNLIHS